MVFRQEPIFYYTQICHFSTHYLPCVGLNVGPNESHKLANLVPIDYIFLYRPKTPEMVWDLEAQYHLNF